MCILGIVSLTFLFFQLDELREESVSNLMLTYESLVGSSLCSDFTFKCCGSIDVPAHKAILIARCDVLKQVGTYML